MVIGYDRRFSSEFFAQAAAEVLLAHDVPVAFASGAIPTQMVSYEVVERTRACGMMITASHNPWTDNGFKVKSESGAAGGPAMLATVEAAIRDSAGRTPPTPPVRRRRGGRPGRSVRPYDGYVEYVAALARPGVPARAADMRVLVEPMWGCGAGWISRMLAGGKIQVTELHTERNPWFGGVNPEPIRPNIDEALGVLAGGGYDLGLLLDGDADRAGRGRRAGHVHPPAAGDGPADVLPASSTAACASRSSRRSTRRAWSAGWARSTTCRCTRHRSASSTSAPRSSRRAR